MVLLTRLNGTQFYVNADLIQTVEETPNTVVTLLDHTHFVVTESAETIVDRYIRYRQRVNQTLQINTGMEE